SFIICLLLSLAERILPARGKNAFLCVQPGRIENQPWPFTERRYYFYYLILNKDFSHFILSN
ncbi:MAG: hypothetical protein ACJ708_07165, partial [Nitrososphaeraceae archaeon]